jgi:hypothetical protein
MQYQARLYVRASDGIHLSQIVQICVNSAKRVRVDSMCGMAIRLLRRPAGALRQSPAFFRLRAAAAISAGGDRITRLALPIPAVAALGAGPFHVGLLLTFEQLPQLLFTLVAGAWIDRLVVLAGPLGISWANHLGLRSSCRMAGAYDGVITY